MSSDAGSTRDPGPGGLGIGAHAATGVEGLRPERGGGEAAAQEEIPPIICQVVGVVSRK